MVLVGSRCSERFSVVPVGSHRFLVVLSRCRMFSADLYGCHRFSVVFVGSQWFS